MCEENIKLVLKHVQENSTCHKKYLLVLEKQYHESPTDEFIEIFLKYLKSILQCPEKNRDRINRIIEFTASFIKKINDDEEQNATQIGEDSNNEFISIIIKEIIKYHRTINDNYRYNACKFVATVFEQLRNATLNNDICDKIQEAMLVLINDQKSTVRLEAIKALERLQEPRNNNCPVIKAYIPLLCNRSPIIRREVVKVLALSFDTASKIAARTRDRDHSVRQAAFQRCGEFGPKAFRIVERHAILTNGFYETNQQVQKFFKEHTLNKWFWTYNNIGAFLKSFKLDADESDVESTFKLSEIVLNELFKSESIEDIIGNLSLDDKKLIPLNELSSEITTFWYFLSEYLRNSEDLENYLDSILPELSPFCDYIKKIVEHYSNKEMEEWEILGYQTILLNLFNILEKYDKGDEVGRQNCKKMILSLLQNHKFMNKVLYKMLKTLSQLYKEHNELILEICEIISDIRAPLVMVEVKELPKHPRDNLQFKMAQLSAKLNMLLVEEVAANADGDSNKIAKIQEEMAKINEQINELKIANEPKKIEERKVDNSKETNCRCLDILNAVLMLPKTNQITPSLRSYFEEFVVDLLKNEDIDIHWRVLKSVALYCIIDKDFAVDYGKILAIPIASYRILPKNKMIVITSLEAIGDFFMLYGSDLLCVDESVTSSKKQLYQADELSEDGSEQVDNMSLTNMMNKILDMLDDEDEDIKDSAIIVIMKLVLRKISVNPGIISRIILKWYNPTVDAKLKQKIGFLITKYSQDHKESKKIIGKAILPTLTTLLLAPKESPLNDVNLDNVMRFLSTLSNDTQVHTDIAMQICQEINKQPENVIIGAQSKILLYLNIDKTNEGKLNEIMSLLKIICKKVENKKVKKNLEKVLEKLKNNEVENTQVTEPSEMVDETNKTGGSEMVDETNNTEASEVVNESNRTETSEPVKKKTRRELQVLLNNEIVINEKQVNNKQTKRKKSRGNRKSQQNSSFDKELIIETPTTSNSDIEERITVITETSSESEASSGSSSLRRSKRNRKEKKTLD